MLRDLEVIYLGHANRIDLVLLADDEVPSLASVTRMVLVIGDVTVDSSVTAGAFDWTQTVTDEEAREHPEASTGDPKIVIDLGGVTGLEAGLYDAPLVVYDPSHTNGLVWGTVPIRVEDSVIPSGGGA